MIYTPLGGGNLKNSNIGLILLLYIVTKLNYSHSWKMGSCHHIGKRRIFVCRRDCRSASVLRHWDSVLFFAYPMGGGKFVNTHIQLSSVRLLRDVRLQGMGIDLLGHTPIRSVDSSISEITATPVAPYPPPSNEVGESVLIVLALDRSARSIFHWVKGYLFHILISHSGT